MTAAILARAPRQSAIVTTVATLHVGAFLAIASGMGLPAVEVPGEQTIYVLPKPPEPVREPTPDFPPAQDFTPELVAWPILDPLTARDEVPTQAAGVQAGTTAEPGGSGPAVDFVAPSLRMHGDRLAALVGSCYPPAARRLDEEGRAFVRIAVSADGRAASWSLAGGTGFTRLDSAVECVVRRLQFQPGRREGRAVAAEVQLPIVFRLN